MTITTLINGLPVRTMDQDTFDVAVAKVFTDLPTWAGEVNSTAANMNVAAAGGAYSIPYTFDTTTTDADPTAGKLRLSSATQNASTVLRLDLFSSGGQDFTSVLDTFDASTSTVKGQIRLAKQGDAFKWLLFNVTARATPSGYRNITVVNVGSSAASPFTNGDPLILSFTRTGDLGATGSIGFVLKVSDQKTAGTNGGSSSGAVEQVRTLNTVEINEISGASLSSNTITLPAGSYEVWARAPATSAGSASLRLYNTADSAYTIVGSSTWCSSGVSGQVDSFVSGKFTIAATKTFQLKHYIGTALGTFGLGNSSGSGVTEVYAEAIFRKVA